jgi:hypothetical protein
VHEESIGELALLLRLREAVRHRKRGGAAEFGPDPERLGPCGTALISGCVFVAELGEIVDLVVSGKKTLSLAG